MPVSFFLVAAIILIIIVGLVVLSGNRYLKTEAANPAEVQGQFKLMLYGSSSRNDLANVAILDKEGDPYSFEIDAPDFSFTVQAGLSAEQALREAERFVRRNIHFERSRLHSILGPAGRGIGYELRPLYSIPTFGREDILNVRYSIKDRKIVVHIELDPEIERQSTN